MKKIVFIEAEGVLFSFGDYVANERRVKTFFEELINFCEKNKILLYVISGYHNKIAHENLIRVFKNNV